MDSLDQGQADFARSRYELKGDTIVNLFVTSEYVPVEIEEGIDQGKVKYKEQRARFAISRQWNDLGGFGFSLYTPTMNITSEVPVQYELEYLPGTAKFEDLTCRLMKDVELILSQETSESNPDFDFVLESIKQYRTSRKQNIGELAKNYRKKRTKKV
jgi:hypothetical protein